MNYALCNPAFPETQSGRRCGLRTPQRADDYPEPESIVAVLKRKKKVQEIPVIMRARAGGVSSISPLNSIYYMVKVTIAILIERIR